MSYRLIDSNAIANKYPEVNNLPCVYADLPNGLDGSFITQHWIPVTDWLPKEKGEYMVTVEYYGWHGEKGRMLTSARYTKTKGWHLSSGKVIAWMELPKPWEGEKDGQN